MQYTIIKSYLRLISPFEINKCTFLIPSVFRHCWSGGRKGMRQLKSRNNNTFTGYVYRSESSFGCVFWHITVCMALYSTGVSCRQPAADIRHRRSSPIRHLRSADTTTLLLAAARLVVKTGSAKTKTKTANGSMKQNAHSSRKNYFYQKLQRHWLIKFTTEYCI